MEEIEELDRIIDVGNKTDSPVVIKRKITRALYTKENDEIIIRNNKHLTKKIASRIFETMTSKIQTERKKKQMSLGLGHKVIKSK